jgi:hypothetical protein
MANISGNSSANHLKGKATADYISGHGGNDTLRGAAGDDILDGGSGADYLFGDDGNDTLIWHASDARIDGGDGTDILSVAGSAAMNLIETANAKITGIEIVDLAGTNTLTLSASDVRALSGTTNSLRVEGEAGDAVDAVGGWTQIASITSGGQTYARYTLDGATLEVDVDVDRGGITVAELRLAALDGPNGSRINGVAAGDYAGHSVSSAGDVNGDGYADLLIGAYGADAHGESSGAAYVVFGTASGFAANLDLSELDATRGLRISGEAEGDQVGFGVSEAGDVNGDGHADFLVGAFGADPNGVTSGAAYVVFGTAGDLDYNLDLSALDGSNGFQLSGVAADDRAARVSAAGDVNGDGYGDLIIGADWADPHAIFNAGAAYVVFGAAGGFGSNLDLSALDGTNGFKLSGEAWRDCAGYAISDVGDVNGDGFDDVIVGARGADPNGSYSGSSYVVYGAAGGFDANLELSALDGTSGFQISGEAAGDQASHSLSAAGDVNGDGFADFVIGAWGVDDNGNNAGSAYVVFGAAGGFGSNLDLSTLDGTNGFQLPGGWEGDLAGFSAVGGAGDMNGDGYDDVIVGAFVVGVDAIDPGAAYVVFGAAGGFGATLELSSLDGSNGFQLSGEAHYDCAGRSVSGAGDVNGDGFADLLIGAHQADGGGADSGASYVVYGRDFNGVVDFVGTAGADALTGTAATEAFVAGRGNDTMTGGGGADSFRGGSGSDTVRIHNASFSDVDGGSGNDTLAVTRRSLGLDLTTVANTRIAGIEVIDLGSNGKTNALALALDDVLDLSDTTNTLKIKGAAVDSVTVTDGAWHDAGTAGNYHVYTLGAAMLKVDVDVTNVTISLAG